MSKPGIRRAETIITISMCDRAFNTNLSVSSLQLLVSIQIFSTLCSPLVYPMKNELTRCCMGVMMMRGKESLDTRLGQLVARGYYKSAQTHVFEELRVAVREAVR
jgi:hypothetical protein